MHSTKSHNKICKSLREGDPELSDAINNSLKHGKTQVTLKIDSNAHFLSSSKHSEITNQLTLKGTNSEKHADRFSEYSLLHKRGRLFANLKIN